MTVQRSSRPAIVGGVAAVLLVAGGVATARSLAEHPGGNPVAAVAKRNAEPPSLELQCESGMSQGGTLDFVGPGSAADAKAQGWPTSPEEAAQATFGSRMFMAVRLRDLTLEDGERVELPNGAVVVQFPATASDGSTQGLITVEELVEGFWSTTHIASCAEDES